MFSRRSSGVSPRTQGTIPTFAQSLSLPTGVRPEDEYARAQLEATTALPMAEGRMPRYAAPNYSSQLPEYSNLGAGQDLSTSIGCGTAWSAVCFHCRGRVDPAGVQHGKL